MVADLHTRIRDEIARRRALAEAVPGSWEAFGTWVGIKVDGCTCAGGWEWVPHEPHCGFEPLVNVQSKDLAAFIAANGPDVALRWLDMAEAELADHDEAGCCPCVDDDEPCSFISRLAFGVLGIDPAGIDIEEKTT